MFSEDDEGFVVERRRRRCKPVRFACSLCRKKYKSINMACRHADRKHAGERVVFRDLLADKMVV